MRTLALSDEILMKVDKAARYIGGEVNSVMKDKNDVDIRFAMCFPDVYEIGMSNLGMMTFCANVMPLIAFTPPSVKKGAAARGVPGTAPPSASKPLARRAVRPPAGCG